MDPQFLVIVLIGECIIQSIPDLLGQQIRPAVYHTINIYLRNKTRRLIMVTSHRPILTVELITEGVIGRTTNAATGRVVNRVC